MDERAQGAGVEEREATWGDFELDFDTELGRGGMGVVYRARQISLDRTVAVKVLDPDGETDRAILQAFIEKFRAEAKALAWLDDPRIVKIIQAGETNGRFWFAMELVEGETLDDIITRRGALPEEEAARVAAEVARALDAAHRRGVIHRDVKPGNIFVCDGGAVKVADWGLAKTVGSGPGHLTLLQHITCTPSYASPEQANGDDCDFCSDVYSLGVVLFEMLCECPPFQSESAIEILFRQINEPAPSPRILNPAVSEGMEEIVLRCLAKDPNHRFSSYSELIGALESVRRKRPETAPARRRSRIPALVFLLGLLSIFAGVFAMISAPREDRGRSSPDPHAAVNIEPLAEAPDDPEPEPPEVPDAEPPATEPASPPPDEAGNEPEPVYEVILPAPAEPEPARPAGPREVTREELALLRELNALYELHDAEIRSFDYQPAIEALRRFSESRSAEGLANHALQRLERAHDIYGRFHSELGPDKEATLLVCGPNGETKTLVGSVSDVTPEGIVFDLPDRPQPVRVRFQELNAETYVLDADPAERILFLATHGEDGVAARLLFEQVKEGRSDLLVHLPGVVHASALGTLRALDRGRLQPAEDLIRVVEEGRALLPDSWQAAVDVRPFLSYEVAAAKLYHAGRFSAILRDYDKSRFAPRAARGLLERFRAGNLKDGLAGAEAAAWRPEPADREAAYREKVDGEWTYVLRGGYEARRLKRLLPEAVRGYSARLSFTAESQPLPSWALAISRPDEEHFIQLQLDGDGIAALRAHATREGEDEVIDRRPIVLPETFTLTVIPDDDLTLVFVGDSFLFALRDVSLDASLQFASRGGMLRIHSVHVPQGNN